MIITIAGKPGAGKTTVAKILAKKLRLKHVSAGDFMRKLARERKMSLLELTRIAKKNREVDREIDRRTVEIGRRKNNFVMDGRIAWKFIPSSIKVFLKVAPNVGAGRVFNDSRKDEKENTTLANVKRNIAEREKAEKIRYKKYYGIDFTDKKHYDILIDTTKLAPMHVAAKIIGFAKKNRNFDKV